MKKTEGDDMVFKMRFVQYFDKRDESDFLEVEKLFERLEEKDSSMIKGRRFVSIIGREPSNALIWEAEFGSLELAMQALTAIKENAEHDALLEKQTPFMRDAYAEIYQEL